MGKKILRGGGKKVCKDCPSIWMQAEIDRLKKELEKKRG